MIYALAYLFLVIAHYVAMYMINADNRVHERTVVAGEYIFIASIAFPFLYVMLIVIVFSKLFIDTMKRKYE